MVDPAMPLCFRNLVMYIRHHHHHHHHWERPGMNDAINDGNVTN